MTSKPLFGPLLGIALAASLIFVQGCSTAPKSPDVTTPISDALKSANLKDVSIKQDRDKGVITLKGSVATEGDKARAESIAKSLSVGQVVGNEIAVLPPGAESVTKEVNSDLDDGIKKNLDAALIQAKLRDTVKDEIQTGVVTLTGDVATQTLRKQAESVAAAVPNVKQVINKIDVPNQKASESK